jgi:translation initiation factor IF-2
MSETKTPDGKTLSVGKSTLSLKPRTETGVVRQSFSHGRSKQVVVEVKKRRTLGADGKPEAAAPAPAAPAAPVAKRAAAAPAAKTAAPAAPAAATPAPAAPAPKASGVVLRTLTDEERDRRAHALGDARLREAEERKIAEEEAKIRAQREAIERPIATPPKHASARKRIAASTTTKPKKKADEVAKRFGGKPRPRRERRARVPSSKRKRMRRPAHGTPAPVAMRPPRRRSAARAAKAMTNVRAAG